MTVILAPARPASQLQPWPRLAACACGQLVLLARGVRQGHPFTLDPIEVLPEKTCEPCHGTGEVIGELRHITITPGRGMVPDGKSPNYADGPVRCAQCNGTGRKGERLGPGHILVSTDGVARPFEGHRFAWEAAHHRHRCPG